jgi:hypothetical protein
MIPPSTSGKSTIKAFSLCFNRNFSTNVEPIQWRRLPWNSRSGSAVRLIDRLNQRFRCKHFDGHEIPVWPISQGPFEHSRLGLAKQCKSRPRCKSQSLGVQDCDESSFQVDEFSYTSSKQAQLSSNLFPKFSSLEWWCLSDICFCYGFERWVLEWVTITLYAGIRTWLERSVPFAPFPRILEDERN